MPTKTKARPSPVAPRQTRPRKPSPWSVDQVIALTEPLYGPAERPRGYDGIAELVYTILSQHTSDTNSTRAYAALREQVPSWDAVAGADVEAIVDAIKVGGLAQIKAPRIQQVVRSVKSLTGGYDLSFLTDLPLEEAKAWLRQLPGVGPKTVGCVLMFALDMPALPVDTHVYRVSKRLGLFDEKVTPDQSHDVLEAALRPEQRLPFHMYLINHGRQVCKAQRPLCGECVLESRCPSSLLRSAGRSAKPKGTKTRPD